MIKCPKCNEQVKFITRGAFYEIICKQYNKTLLTIMTNTEDEINNMLNSYKKANS